MGSYKGSARIVADDGTVIDGIEVSLVSPEPASDDEPWFGTVRGEFDAFDLMDGQPVLELPDGGQSSFRLSRTDLVLPRNGIEIIGTASAPF